MKPIPANRNALLMGDHMRKLQNPAVKVIVLAALAVSSSVVLAAAPDVSATVTAIGEATTPIGLIGIASLGVLVAIKVYKWVRRAM